MIARGGAPLVFSPLVGMAAFLGLTLALEDSRFSYAGLPLGLLFLFLLAFFRDPERVPGRGVVSPADGRVLAADAERGALTIFMGVTNVHVNRAPWDGRITRMTHSPGGHAPAYAPEASKNERLETVLDTKLGPIRITQVAGVFARRIVPYRREGDRVKKGQRIGMIRFGSRVEIVLPKGVKVVARVGQRVRAGETTVAVVTGGGVR